MTLEIILYLINSSLTNSSDYLKSAFQHHRIITIIFLFLIDGSKCRVFFMGVAKYKTNNHKSNSKVFQ